MIIAVAAFAVFLATFNETLLGVAFAPIAADFEIGISTVQWLATAYMLGAAIMVPVAVFLYRSIPTRALFLAIIALLLVGSIIGGLAPNFAVLLVGRTIQALGTGLLIPVAMNITLDVAPRQKLGACMGLMGAMTTLGPSISVILSGILLSITTWHMLLWFFAGLSALCFAFGASVLSTVAKLTRPKLDALSVILISLALIGIFYGLSTIFEGSVVVSLITMVIGACALVCFVVRQNKLEHPLINLNALKVGAFTIGVIMNMLALIIVFAFNILIPLFLQTSFGAPPLFAALTLTPAIVLAAVIAPFAGKFYDKHGAKTLLLAGFILMTAFALILSLFISTGNLVLLALLYLPVMIGSALIIGPVQSFALSRLAPELNAHGVTIMSTGFQIAGCIGVAVFSGIFTAATSFMAGMNPGALPSVTASQGFSTMSLLLVLVGAVGFVLSLRAGRYKVPAKVHAAPSVLAQIVLHDVYTLKQSDKVFDALCGFVDKGVSGMPVVSDEGAVVGFVSDGDIMRYLADQHAAFKSPYAFIIENDNEKFDEKLASLVQLPVFEIATKHVIGVDLNMELGEVCNILGEHHLKKAPVFENGKMVGIINRSNITQYSLNTYREKLGVATA
jgi:DHA2 family lincomycin resistance protein-like MFS transporter